MRVLIADDDPTCREVLAHVLRESGHDVIVAQNGNEAWGVLQNPQSPRLVFLDWVMPGMEGPEVCHRLRKRKDGNYVYVIMLTSNEGVERLQEAFEAGVNDFVSKMAPVEELEARVSSAHRFFKLYDELASARETIRHLQQYDIVTGLEGRRAVLEALQKEVLRARDRASSLAVALVKVDHFDMINETYGRRAAEQVLREAARCISSSIRPYDVAGRTEDDEFLILVPDFSAEEMVKLAEGIRKTAANEPVRVGGETIAFTASLGVAAACPTKDQDAADFLAPAREALGQACRSHGNRVASASAETVPAA